jgi:hypothetical protein
MPCFADAAHAFKRVPGGLSVVFAVTGEFTRDPAPLKSLPPAP